MQGTTRTVASRHSIDSLEKARQVSGLLRYSFPPAVDAGCELSVIARCRGARAAGGLRKAGCSYRLVSVHRSL